jgi:hypothetical protein
MKAAGEASAIPVPPQARPPKISRFSAAFVRGAGIAAVWLVVPVLNLWAIAALYVDCRIVSLRIPLVLVYASVVVLVLAMVKRGKALVCLGLFCAVLGWWLTLKPTNEANWRPDDARTAWAAVDGDRVTIHNVRNCDYRSETEYTDCWSDRVYDLSQLRGIDFFFVNWGIRWIGHPIVSFDFGEGQHLAFSIEARYKEGQSYSSLLGFFRQYELIFVAADERDLIRLRTNYRKDEEVYLYRAAVPPTTARHLFLIYVAHLNRLREHPEWYNAVTRNCTTAIDGEFRAELPAANAWTYRLLLNGDLDALEYERGRLVTGGLTFAELKRQAHINAFAHSIDQAPDFSTLIRAGRVGF